LENEKSIIIFTKNKPFLGAQIVQIPFYFFLKRKFPGYKIVAVAPTNSAFVLNELGYTDEVYYYPPKKNVKILGKLFFELRKLNIHCIFQFRLVSLRTLIYSRFLTTKPIIGFKGKFSRVFLNKRIIFDRDIYIANNYLFLLGRSLAEFSSLFDKAGGNYFLIIPAGNEDFKKYPIEKYIQAANILKGHHPVHFLLGKDMQREIDLLSQTKNTFTLHVQLQMTEIESLVRNACVVIANDCGPSHFAHIYDIPRVSIFPGIGTDWFYQTNNSIMLYPSYSESIAKIEPEKICECTLKLLNNSQKNKRL